METIRHQACALMILALVAGSAAMAAPIELVQGVYRADRHFPEFINQWIEGWDFKGEDGKPLVYAHEKMPLGGYFLIYLRNTGDQPVSIRDVRLDGIGLKEAIRLSEDVKAGIHPANVRFAKIPQEQIERLLQAGEPVWFKSDPKTIPPGGYANVTIRMRRNPPTADADLEIVCGDATLPVRVDTGKAHPWFATIRFSQDYSEVTAYVRTEGGRGAAPVRFNMDGRDLTGQSRILVDPELDTSVVIAKLDRPATRGSFHYFQADTPDGARAAAMLRADADEFRYGMWGYINKGETPRERADYFLKDMEAHNINILMYSISRDVQDFMMSEEGVAYSGRTGMRMMASAPGNARRPVYLFLLDEPDAQDAAVGMLKPTLRLGSLGQGLVEKSGAFQAKDPESPILLNIDNTFKPENWYMYAQLPDVMCADPYWIGELQGAMKNHPDRLEALGKPTYVYAVSSISRWASAPKPLHIILNCVRNDAKDSPFRFNTPIEKRIEVYYALAGGATSLSYWWYTPYDECYGVGGDDPRGRALWREMGLLGAEVRTAGPVLVQSSPATLPVKASPNLWVRTLISGADTAVLLVVNDTVRGNRTGSTIETVKPADVTVRLPAWLKCRSVFEVESGGVKDVKSAIDGQEVTVSPGQAKVARMFILTADTGLRNRLQDLYKTRFASTVARLRQAR